MVCVHAELGRQDIFKFNVQRSTAGLLSGFDGRRGWEVASTTHDERTRRRDGMDSVLVAG